MLCYIRFLYITFNVSMFRNPSSCRQYYLRQIFAIKMDHYHLLLKHCVKYLYDLFVSNICCVYMYAYLMRIESEINDINTCSIFQLFTNIYVQIFFQKYI